MEDKYKQRLKHYIFAILFLFYVNLKLPFRVKRRDYGDTFIEYVN